MKKFHSLIVAIVLLVGFTACSEKFNVAAPYKSIAVVWGFLDEADTAHYVRIEKAFLDQNKNAITMATVADSSYFSNLNVRMERVDFQGTGNVFDTIHLVRVNMATEGYPKQSGVFFDSPSYAYKFTNALNNYYSYRLVITNPATGAVDSVETPIIDDAPPPNQYVTPTFYVPLIDDTTVELAGLDFGSTNQYLHTDINATYNTPSGFNWNGYASPIGIAEILIQFNWDDSDVVNNNKIAQSFLYNFGYTTLTSQGQLNFQIPHTQMYSALLDALGNAPTNMVRLLDRCQLYVYFSTPDYNTYVQVEETQGSGLTGNEIEPTYTNIKGKNVLGMFTGRGMRSGYVTIDASTVDSVKSNAIFTNSRIVGTVYH